MYSEDRAEFDKLDELIKEIILLETNQVDLTLIIDKATAKDQWDALLVKYKDSRKQVMTIKQKKFVNYEKKKDQSVQDTWAALHKIRNDIIVIKSSLAEVYDTEELLYRLYDYLSTKYSIIVIVLKSNKKKNENKALRIL